MIGVLSVAPSPRRRSDNDCRHRWLEGHHRDEFTRENVRLLAQGLADRMHAEGVVERGLVISYDRRFLSDVAAWWAIEVLAGNGIPVRVITRPVPTPMCMWTVKQTGAAYGIAVTASHNPALYNGLKIFTEGGRDAELEVTDELAAHVATLAPADVRSWPRTRCVTASWSPSSPRSTGTSMRSSPSWISRRSATRT